MEVSNIIQNFQDVVGVPQVDGSFPIAAIQYKADFTNLMDIFRAVFLKEEKSERVLELTEILLQMNAANYTVWQYRRECLRNIEKETKFLEEFVFMDSFAKENPKNYQIWFHRRVIVDYSGDASRELGFCDRVFSVDAKNYHAWAHRQWVTKAYNLWGNEFATVDNLLFSDIRNNSAWNHRWFVICEYALKAGTTSVTNEIDYVFNAIEKAPDNESPWNYLKGICNNHKDVCSSVLDTLLEYENPNHFCHELIAFLTVMLTKDGSVCVSDEKKVKLFRDAGSIYQQLALRDGIRAKFWQKKKTKLVLQNDL